MNSSLSEIQADIQRLASQQNQIQQQHLMTQHQKQMQQQLQQLQSLSQQHMQVSAFRRGDTSRVAIYISSQFLKAFASPADLRNAADESVSAQTTGSATITILFARSAASAEENVGSAGTRPEPGQ